jgi:hypothetical protein
LDILKANIGRIAQHEINRRSGGLVEEEVARSYPRANEMLGVQRRKAS